MKVCAVIAELNPFHNGHANVLRLARETLGADFIIVLMSGDYVQRGAPAIVDKFTRTRMALTAGADIVLELPLYYSLGSAEYFAAGAVALLNRLEIVDLLVFGSECGNISHLYTIARMLTNEPASLRLHLQTCLKAGDSYPLARKKALQMCLPEPQKKLADLLDEPNNLLAVEYLRAMISTGAPYEAETVKRTAGVSAETIRASLLSPYGRIRKASMPESCAVILKEYVKHGGRVFADNNGFSVQLRYLLQMQNEAQIARMADVSEALARRIYKLLPEYDSFDGFAMRLKSRDLTYTRIQRALLHILLHMTQDSLAEYRDHETVYARVLGFRNKSSVLFTHLKEHASLPLITKLSRANVALAADFRAQRMLQEDIRASAVYDAAFAVPGAPPLKNEYEKKMVIL